MPGLTIKKQVYRIIYWQLILIMGLALLLFLLHGIQSGFSALLGGLAYWLPTFLFVCFIFAKTAAQSAKQFLLLFIAGEGLKLLLSALLFVLIIEYMPLKYMPANIFSILIGFVGAIISLWIASFVIFTKGERP
ncbi:MAG TPA: ATP synthase subunit I [Gammaproteobacteria bacterium]|nr:ATP synthase subunit I [Gammaproteobacteria bacterium]